MTRLRSDPLYRHALKMAKNDAERRRIIATTEAVAEQFVDVLSKIGTQITNDPSQSSALQEALKRGAAVVNERDGKIASGSR